MERGRFFFFSGRGAERRSQKENLIGRDGIANYLSAWLVAANR